MTPQNTPLSAQDRMIHLEGTLGEICTLLDRETKAVKDVDLKQFSALQPEKEALLDGYAADIRALLDQRDALKQLPEEVKAKIRALESRLAETQDQNLNALAQAGKSFTRLRDRIVDLAKTSVLRHQPAYGARGTLQSSARKPVSMGINDQA